MTKQHIMISICPTNMEIDGQAVDEDAYFAAVRQAVAAKYSGAWIEIQSGYSQGDEWFRVGNRESEELRELVQDIQLNEFDDA